MIVLVTVSVENVIVSIVVEIVVDSSVHVEQTVVESSFGGFDVNGTLSVVDGVQVEPTAEVADVSSVECKSVVLLSSALVVWTAPLDSIDLVELLSGLPSVYDSVDSDSVIEFSSVVGGCFEGSEEITSSVSSEVESIVVDALVLSELDSVVCDSNEDGVSMPSEDV